MSTATCAICQREFERKSNALYCSKECKLEARRQQFHTDAGRERARLKKQRQRERDPEHQRELVRQSRTRHHDKRDEDTKRWIAEHPEYRKEYSRKWRQEHPEQKSADGKRYYAENKEKVSARISAYSKAHPEILQVKNSRRRALLRNATGIWTAQEFLALCTEFENCCSYCGATCGRLTPDHIIPLSCGGTNDITNITPACLSCNASKGDKTAEEYIAYLERTR